MLVVAGGHGDWRESSVGRGDHLARWSYEQLRVKEHCKMINLFWFEACFSLVLQNLVIFVTKKLLEAVPLIK